MRINYEIHIKEDLSIVCEHEKLFDNYLHGARAKMHVFSNMRIIHMFRLMLMCFAKIAIYLPWCAPQREKSANEESIGVFYFLSILFDLRLALKQNNQCFVLTYLGTPPTFHEP